MLRLCSFVLKHSQSKWRPEPLYLPDCILTAPGLAGCSISSSSLSEKDKLTFRVFPVDALGLPGSPSKPLDSDASQWVLAWLRRLSDRNQTPLLPPLPASLSPLSPKEDSRLTGSTSRSGRRPQLLSWPRIDWHRLSPSSCAPTHSGLTRHSSRELAIHVPKQLGLKGSRVGVQVTLGREEAPIACLSSSSTSPSDSCHRGSIGQ